jgi:hypothetical protein
LKAHRYPQSSLGQRVSEAAQVGKQNGIEGIYQRREKGHLRLRQLGRKVPATTVTPCIETTGETAGILG